jgi:hypothetical protein
VANPSTPIHHFISSPLFSTSPAQVDSVDSLVSRDDEFSDSSTGGSVVFGKRPVTPPKPRVSKLSLMLDSTPKPSVVVDDVTGMVNRRRAVKFAKEQQVDKAPLQRRYTVAAQNPEMDREKLRRRGLSFDEFGQVKTRRVVSVRMGTTPRMEWEMAEAPLW